MAAAGATPISLYYSATAGHVPTAGNLVNGELAINIADSIIYFKNASGVVTPFTSGGTPGGATTNVQYNNAGAFAGNANFTYNGTTVTTANDMSIHGITVGQGLTAGVNSTAVGLGVLAVSTGANNVAVGSGSLAANTTATNNTAVGTVALNANTTGISNSAFGSLALFTNTTGQFNTGLGVNSLQLNSTGSNNTAVGLQSLYSNTTASNNTAVGYQAGYSTQADGDSTFIGYQAGYSFNAGSGSGLNTFVGRYAGYSTTTGLANTYIGQSAGYAMTTGSQNTILGTFNGNQNGLDIRTASNYIVLSDGAGNPRITVDNTGATKIGAIVGAVNGAEIFSVGSSSLAGPAGFYGPSNTALYSMYIQNAAGNNTASPMIRFSTSDGTSGNITSTLLATVYATASDYRLKENISPMTGALAVVEQLNPVTYDWKLNGASSNGFIAHELQAIFPEAVTGTKDAIDADGNPDYQAIDTSFLVATLTAAIKELKAQNDALTTRIAALEAK